jgi:hypothetical protein
LQQEIRLEVVGFDDLLTLTAVHLEQIVVHPRAIQA